MKLNKEFISHNDAGEAMLVPTGNAGFAGIVRGNATFGAVVECLENDTTEEGIIQAMLEKYEAPREKIEADVKKVLESLRSIGAIDE